MVRMGGDRRPGGVAGDLAAHVLAWDAGLAAQQRDEHPVDVLAAELRAAVGEQHVDQLAGLAVGNLGCAGRTACQASIALPTSGSTGLVNALVVLLTGTSSRHTRSPPSTVSGVVCQRIAPTLS